MSLILPIHYLVPSGGPGSATTGVYIELSVHLDAYRWGRCFTYPGAAQLGSLIDDSIPFSDPTSTAFPLTAISA